MIIEDIETDDCTIEELVLTRIEWQAKVDHIIAQLKGAKEIYLATGENSDPDWSHRARYALSVSAANIKKLDVVIKRRNVEAERERREAAHQRKTENLQRFEKAFIDAAKRELDPEMFSHLIDAARLASEKP